MALWRFWGGKKQFEPEPDSVWLDQTTKYEAVANKAKSLSDQGPVLVLAHFDSTMRDLEATFAHCPAAKMALNDSQVFDLLARPRMGVIMLAGTRDLVEVHQETSHFQGEASFLVAERFPTPDRDSAVCLVANTLPYTCRVQFFLALDDEIVSRFSGDHIRTVVSALGVEPHEEISHPMINKAIASAQKKVARTTRSLVHADSPADWFQSNIER